MPQANPNIASPEPTPQFSADTDHRSRKTGARLWVREREKADREANDTGEFQSNQSWLIFLIAHPAGDVPGKKIEGVTFPPSSFSSSTPLSVSNYYFLILGELERSPVRGNRFRSRPTKLLPGHSTSTRIVNPFPAINFLAQVLLWLTNIKIQSRLARLPDFMGKIHCIQQFSF